MNAEQLVERRSVASANHHMVNPPDECFVICVLVVHEGTAQEREHSWP